MLNDFLLWGSDAKAIELGYSLSELQNFYVHAEKGVNFVQFVKRTNHFFQIKNEEFYHNLAVLKTAALWIDKFQSQVEYLLPTKKRGVKSPDLLVINPMGVRIALEVKQKIKLSNSESMIKNLGLKAFDEFSKLGYDVDIRLTKEGHLQKDIDRVFPELIKFVVRQLSEGQLSGSDPTNIIIWKAQKRTNLNEGHHSFRTLNYPYLKYWARDKHILEEAHEQISAMMATNVNVKLGVIVLDLCHINFDINDAINTINDWKKTKKNLMILILRHPGYQYKNRLNYCDDFYAVKD